MSTPGWLTEAEMIEVDRVMVEDLGIELIQMMENAGRNLAQLAIERYGPASVVIYAGSGGNGGGGMVAARHLANRGVDIAVVTTRPPAELTGVPRHQAAILERMGVSFAGESPAADVVIDAVIGYSLRGAPAGRSAELIAAMNAGDAAVLALDLPSGLDATTGEAPGVVVSADMTLTLAAPKLGLRDAATAGQIHVADISVPPAVLTALGHPAPDFSSAPIVELG